MASFSNGSFSTSSFSETSFLFGDDTPQPTPVKKTSGPPLWVRQFLLKYKTKEKRKKALARLLLLID